MDVIVPVLAVGAEIDNELAWYLREKPGFTSLRITRYHPVFYRIAYIVCNADIFPPFVPRC